MRGCVPRRLDLHSPAKSATRPRRRHLHARHHSSRGDRQNRSSDNGRSPTTRTALCAVHDCRQSHWRQLHHPRNIDGRPFDFVKSGQRFMHPQNPTAKERSETKYSGASFLGRWILKRSGGASRVEINALRAPLTPLPTSLGDTAELRLHQFPQVPEVIPLQKNRSASSVLRNFWARREERPFGVPFERFSFRSERSALR